MTTILNYIYTYLYIYEERLSAFTVNTTLFEDIINVRAIIFLERHNFNNNISTYNS